MIATGRSDLSGRPEDPWKHEQMIVLRRPTTLELLTFSTHRKPGGVRSAICCGTSTGCSEQRRVPSPSCV